MGVFFSKLQLMVDPCISPLWSGPQPRSPASSSPCVAVSALPSAPFLLGSESITWKSFNSRMFTVNPGISVTMAVCIRTSASSPRSPPSPARSSPRSGSLHGRGGHTTRPTFPARSDTRSFSAVNLVSLYFSFQSSLLTNCLVALITAVDSRSMVSESDGD